MTRPYRQTSTPKQPPQERGVHCRIVGVQDGVGDVRRAALAAKLGE